MIIQSAEKNDTTAFEYRNGKDMQGIPWEGLNYTRDEYREMRLKQYRNYENLLRPHDSLQKVSASMRGYTVLDPGVGCLLVTKSALSPAFRNANKLRGKAHSMIFSSIRGL